MRLLAGIGLVAVLVSCTATDPAQPRAGRADTRQEPSVTTPGLTLSGRASVGTVRSF